METSIITRASNSIRRSKRSTLFTFMFIFLLIVQAQDWHSGSSYRRAITFNGADFTEDVTDFLYYFTITDQDLSYTDACSFVKNGLGYDVVFTDVNGVLLEHEIIEYDAVGTYRGWVEVPSISSTSNTMIYMYYGERGVPGDPTLDVYRPDMVATWHFDTGAQEADATSNGLDLAISGATWSAVEDTGILDSCVTFDGSDDHLLIDDASLNFGNGSFSIEGWINVQPKQGASPSQFLQIEVESSQHAEEMLNTSDFLLNELLVNLGRSVSQYNDFSMVGIQFPSVGVPAGNTLTDAYVEFVAQNDGSGFAQFDIGVENTDNPNPYSVGDPPSGRGLTAPGQIQWLPTSWEAGQTYRTPNIASLIQPLVSGAWSTRTVAVQIDGFGVREADDEIKLVLEYESPGNGSTLYQLPVESFSDDAEEALNGSVELTGALTIRSTANNWVAVRFDNVAVPNNAVIDSVKVRFTANSNGTTLPSEVNISRQNSFTTSTFTGIENELSSLPKTGSVDWFPDEWYTNESHETPDLISLFTNFFSDPQWSAGNAITLFFQPVSAGGGRTAKSVAASGTSQDPQLLVYYRILENEPQTIISRRDADGGFGAWVDEFGKLNFAIDDDGTWDPDLTVTSLDNVDDIQWYHFAGVKEQDKLTLYLNGEPQDSRSETHETFFRLLQDSGDDAEENLSNGSVTTTSGTLDFGSNSSGNDQIVGLRFQNVQIPPGATIVSSFIQIVSVSDAINLDPCTVTITGHRGNMANPFNTNPNSISDLVNANNDPMAGNVSPSQDWTIEEFNDTSSAYDSPDISEIVAYNISSNWGPTNDDMNMAFFISGTNTSRREVRARDSPIGDAGAVATLFIEFKTSNYGSISGAGTPTMYFGDDTDQLLTSDENLLGSLDELRVYSTALSATDVRARYRTIADAANFSTIATSPEQVTWTGGGGDGDWTNSANWNLGMSAPWDFMDFVYTNSGTPLDLQATLNAGHISAAAGVSFDLNDQQVNIDCNCNVETFEAGPSGNGIVVASGSNTEFSSPGSSTTIPNLQVGANNTIALNADLVVSNSLSFADATGNLNANGQGITFGSPTVYNPAFTMSNTIYLGSAGSLTINNVSESETAIFHVSYDNTAASFARAELTNNEVPLASYTLQLCNEVYLDGTCSGTAIEVNDVNKTWFITSASTDSYLRLYWHESMEGPEFERASAEINHYDVSTQWDLLGNEGSTEHLANTIYSAQALNVNTFSPFSVSSHSAPLPVELVHFEAKQEEKSIKIEWQTATELNNDHFILEKSTDGVHFDQLERVKGKGNSSEVEDYRVIDKHPVVGQQYYRLTQVDFDGTMEQLGIRMVEYVSSNSVIDMFPNPVTDEVGLKNLHPGNYKAEIISLDGKLLKKQSLAIDNYGQMGYVNLDDLPIGVFTLKLTTGNFSYSMKLVKK